MKDIDSKASRPIILAAAISGFAVMGSLGFYRAHQFKSKVLTATDKVRTGSEEPARTTEHITRLGQQSAANMSIATRVAQIGQISDETIQPCGFAAPPNSWIFRPPSARPGRRFQSLKPASSI